MKAYHWALGVAFVAGVVALARSFLGGGSSSPAPSGVVHPSPATHEAPQVSDGSDQGIYQTHPDDAELDPTGNVAAGGVLVTALPLRDRKTGLFARLTYADALIVAARLGASLLTAEIQDAIARAGIVLDPCTLPPTSSMRSLAWAQHEDACITAQLAARGYDGSKPVTVAKDYLADAPAGHGRIRGWFVLSGTNKGAAPPEGVPIQPDSSAHDPQWNDYSQLLRLTWPAEAA
jgi:hypothetical protein